MNAIHILSTDLANKIAAGEVIERPASVVKELVENSLDANATHITITLLQSGFARIQVTDNGDGMTKTDLPLALASHATSKVKTVNDLNAILSLGFRGEALASIQSVSHCTVQSHHRADTRAFQINNDDEKSMGPMPVAHPVGTTIIVNDLFYNVPARRKFLRSEKTEFSHCEEVIRRIALSRFDVGFTLIHDKRTVFKLPVAIHQHEKEKRLHRLLGKAFLSQCLHFDIERAGLHWQGWSGLPTLSRSQLDRQYCFVNGRVVRDKLLNHAIRQAYIDHLPVGRYPCIVLFLDCDPKTVDVNVHPAKHEVRFYDARLVHDGLVHTLQAVLEQRDVSINPGRTDDTIQIPCTIPTPQNLTHNEPWKVVLPTKENNQRLSGVLHQRYLAVEFPQGVRIIDGIKAHELWVTCQLTQAVQEEKPLKTQPLLLPIQLNLPRSLSEIWERIETQLALFGVMTALVNPTRMVLRYIPALLHGLDSHLFLNTLLEQLQKNHHTLTNEIIIQWIAKSAAAYLKERGITQEVGCKIFNEINDISLEFCEQVISLDLSHRESVKVPEQVV